MSLHRLTIEAPFCDVEADARKYTATTQAEEDPHGRILAAKRGEPPPVALAEAKGDSPNTPTGRVLPWMPRHRDLAEGLRTYLEVAGVTRGELHTTDATRKAMTFHDLRATGLTWLAIRGDDPLKIKQRVGHSAFTTTEGYIREAEAVRDGFGDVFPAPPASLLPSALSTELGSKRSNIWSKEARPGEAKARSLAEIRCGWTGLEADPRLRRCAPFATS